MGVLDDAIREHLELKRRHGASDEEIAQKEAEALGPARRDFPVPQQAEPDAEPHVDAAPDAEPEPAHEPEPLVDPLPADPLAKETVAPTVIDEPALEPEPEQALKPEPEHEPEPESEHEPEPRRKTRSRNRQPPTRTSSKRPRNSFRTRPSTTASGSSRSRLATSISTDRTFVQIRFERCSRCLDGTITGARRHGGFRRSERHESR
jgi:outer membrane biosynthesis protein TonB